MKINLTFLFIFLSSIISAQSHEALVTDDTTEIQTINTKITLDSSYSSGNLNKSFINLYITSEYDELVAANVEALNTTSNEIFSQLTTDEGEFKMRISPGYYDIKITHKNYFDIYLKNIELKAGEFRLLRLKTNALKP